MLKKFKDLSKTIFRKFEEVLDASNWQISSNQGWTDIKTINKTVPYQKYIIKFKTGNILECADNHILITMKDKQVFAKDSLGEDIATNYGGDKVVDVIATSEWENMYDFELAEDSNHLYYANGILSHNTTLMTIVATWVAVFHPDQTVCIVANKQSTATEIFMRVRLAFQMMENWIKGGVLEFNKTFFTLANGSRILTSATSPDAIRGLAIDVLLLDEFAIIPPKDAEAFWAAVTPTLASRFNNNKNAKLIVASTPKGVGNKFHELVSKAEEGRNDFALEKAFWFDFPGRTEAWKDTELSTMSYDTFTQEYECRFLNNSGSPFDPNMFDKFTKELIEPLNILEDGNYYIWKKPDSEKIYTMGVDTSEGVGQDYSVIQIFDITDPLNIEQVARYSTNTMDITTFAAKVLEIAKQWYSPIMSVERNGPGAHVCEKLFYENNYPRFINFGSGYGPQTPGRKVLPGIITNRVTKSEGVHNMKYYIHDRRVVKIYDKKTIEELRTFTCIRNQSNNIRWCAQPGFHDDHVLALCWSLFALYKKVINNYLIVDKKDVNNIPLVIKKRWEMDPRTDWANTLYKELDMESPFIGVMAGFSRGQINTITSSNDFKQKKQMNLLDFGETLSLDEYRNQITLPNSFDQFGVKDLPNWF